MNLVPNGLAYYVLADSTTRVATLKRLSKTAAAEFFDADKTWPAKSTAIWIDAETQEAYSYDGATYEPGTVLPSAEILAALKSKTAKALRVPGSPSGGVGGVKSGLFRLADGERSGLTAEFNALAEALSDSEGVFDRADVFFAALLYGIEESPARIKVADCVYFGVWTPLQAPVAPQSEGPAAQAVAPEEVAA